MPRRRHKHDSAEDTLSPLVPVNPPTEPTHTETDRRTHARTHANCRESTTLFDPHPRLYAAPAACEAQFQCVTSVQRTLLPATELACPKVKDTLLLNTRPSMFLLWQHPVTTRLSTAMKRAVRK